MKAFFAKIWAWVLAHKLIAGIIAGATVVVLAVAIAVPCGVSASKKRKAAQEETSIPGDNSGSQQGGEQGGGQQGGGSGEHTHSWATTWSHDETNHWHACSGCTEKNDEAAHTIDTYGFCSVCGRYLGVSGLAFSSEGCSMNGIENYYYDITTDQFDMTQGQDYFCRVSGAISGHTFEFVDGDPWTTIDSAISAYAMVNGAPVAVDLLGNDPAQIGTDGYLYIKISAAQLDNFDDVWFQIWQYHDFDAVGYCKCDGCEHHYGGKEVVAGTSSGSLGLRDNEYRYFRAPAVAGHTYKITFTNFGPTSQLDAFVISSTSEYVAFNDIKTSGGAVFPEDTADNYIYIRIIPEGNGPSASFTVNVEGPHSYNGLGICACGDYLGTNLINGVATAPFDLASGAKKFYHYVIVGTGDIVIDLDYSPSNGGAVGSMESEVYLKTSDPLQPFELCEYVDGMNFDAEWQRSDGFFRTGDELYIVIHNTSAVSALNVTVTLAEA